MAIAPGIEPMAVSLGCDVDDLHASLAARAWSNAVAVSREDRWVTRAERTNVTSGPSDTPITLSKPMRPRRRLFASGRLACVGDQHDVGVRATAV
ncbi:MAG: hypothetical protein IPI82_08945, partial [Candidatus Microthrix sp.]